MPNPVEVSRGRGPENLGDLSLYVAWRPKLPLTGEVQNPVLQLPVDVLRVDPQGVLFWDSDPERPNSPKRFAHMLGNRALPLALADDGDLFALIKRNADDNLASHEPNILDLAEMTQRYLDKQSTVEERSYHHRRYTRVVFRYGAPQQLDSLSGLHAYLSALHVRQ